MKKKAIVLSFILSIVVLASAASDRPLFRTIDEGGLGRVTAPHFIIPLCDMDWFLRKSTNTRVPMVRSLELRRCNIFDGFSLVISLLAFMVSYYCILRLSKNCCGTNTNQQ